jgi:2-polyprenyl-6-hydroxyphenyl methylase/3-demethylubiquinone-9 3-methyltransferase
MDSCKICGSASEPFDVVDFGKTCNTLNAYPWGLQGVPVYYSRCLACGFIYTRFCDGFSPDEWRGRIYNEQYAEVDPDYAEVRPEANARFIQWLLMGLRGSTIGLDFGGGSGRTAQLLRSRGWRFDCYDPFGTSTLIDAHAGHYNVATALEVFEHVPDPVAALASILEKTTGGKLLLLIGTGVSDGNVDESRRLSWWYAAPRNGHISLFSRASLDILARRFALNHFSPSPGTHFLTRGISRQVLAARFALATFAMRAAALSPHRSAAAETAPHAGAGPNR